jgi:hypothetical protein
MMPTFKSSQNSGVPIELILYWRNVQVDCHESEQRKSATSKEGTASLIDGQMLVLEQSLAVFLVPFFGYFWLISCLTPFRYGASHSLSRTIAMPVILCEGDSLHAVLSKNFSEFQNACLFINFISSLIILNPNPGV